MFTNHGVAPHSKFVTRSLLAVIACLVCHRVVKADLYRWWKLDDGSGDTAVDSSTNGIDAELFDTEWIDDAQRGTVLSFDGDFAYAAGGFLPFMDLDNDFTWSFWAYQDLAQNTPANDIIIGNRWDEFGVDTSPREFIKFTPNRFEYHMNAGIAFVDADQQFQDDLQYDDCLCPERHIPSDEWIHHAVVKDGSLMTYYRNGEYGNDTEILQEQLSLDPLPFFMGGQDARETWAGLLSDVRLYDHALSAEDVETVMNGGTLGGAPQLQPGDANQDLSFDQLDIVQVSIAAKYLSGNPATWGEGDWNGAPGGSQGNPPAGNGFFDQVDIIAALSAGKYLTGPYAALAPGGVIGDEQTTLVYDTSSGELSVDAPASTQLTSIFVTSASNAFVGDKPPVLDGPFDSFAADNIFKSTIGSSFGDLSFGNVLATGLSEADVLADLSASGSLQGGGGLGEVDLVWVPEPSAFLLVMMAVLSVGAIGRRRG